MTGTELVGLIDDAIREAKIAASKTENVIQELERLKEYAGEVEYRESELYQKRSAQ
ncbi:hypothetical protein FLK61_34270 [Paenalkalicoccus suaedae]|uniref:Uncharacterized protein n=1 Tax=Paenalkalicoccus suaedae TaxID=2592382 RepID=A0A859FGG8_9BACI|nr:hypothetical protein [Paenalkalicoccus suaedae]QKS71690.1 hypothetical protein FLK61_33975 [Paenalkalicoccus suaedae]QKS71744.1 hypothetical protein FLK61_34270 [Paenalkalicoccus suaedae]